MCAVGALGFSGWAISETPEAQKRGSSSAPGICLRNSGANSPCTVEVWMPAFSNTRPLIRLVTRRRRRRRCGPCGSRACARNGRRLDRRGAPAGRSASSRSKAAHSSSRSCSNQARALAAHVAMSRGSRHVMIPASCATRHARLVPGPCAALMLWPRSPISRSRPLFEQYARDRAPGTPPGAALASLRVSRH